MGPDRVYRKDKAKDVAKERGIPYDPDSIFNFAFPRLVDKELSLGETGFFGKKEKWYPDGDGDWLKDSRGKTKALPEANAPKYNPYARRPAMRAPATPMRGIRGR